MNNEKRIELLRQEISNLWEAQKIVDALDKMVLLREIYIETEDINAALNLSKGIGFRYDSLGDYDSAISNYEICLQFSKEIGDDIQHAFALHNIGGIHLKRGNLGNALDFFNQSLLLRRKTNQSARTISESLNNLGRVHFQSNQFDLALDYFQEALSIRNELVINPSSRPQKENLSVEIYRRDLFQSIFDLILYYLEVNQREMCIELLEMMGDLKDLEQINLGEPLHLYAIFSFALYLKEAERIEEKFQSINYLRKITKNQDVKQKYQALAIGHLIELLIMEYRATKSTSALNELSDQIKHLIEIAKSQKSNILHCQGLILQAKINLIEGKLEVADEILEIAEKMAEENQLKVILAQINKEKHILKDELSRWRNMSHEHRDLIKNIEQDKLQEYIKTIQKLGIIEKNDVLEEEDN